ncbi:MAG: glycosyltransferase [Planctomycetota bacterium]
MVDPADPPATHLLHVFATFVAAGPQIRTVALIRRFGNRFRHTIMPMDGQSDAARLLPPDVDVRIENPPAATGPLRRPLLMRRRIQERAPDLLLTYNWGSFDAVLAARTLSGLAHVHHEDGFNIDEAHAQKRRRILLRRLALSRTRMTVVCSRRLEEIARQSWKIPDHRLRRIENGIHTDRFGPGPGLEERRRLGLPEDGLVVGTVGHLRPVKNFHRLLEACARIDPGRAGNRPVHLLLVGDGPERASLEALARDRRPPGGQVVFAGHQESLPDLYRAMDVFALSSDSEQHPVALLEAMCSGLPAAATDVGDVRPILPEAQHRFLVKAEAGDAESALARCLEELLSGEALRAELGQQNRQRVLDRFSFSSMFEAYCETYEAALTGEH